MDKLPQLNLAILFGQTGRLPVYFQRLPGNVTDVTTLRNLLKTFKTLNVKTLHYVMDKGLYSKKNVDALLAARNKFILFVPLNNKWVRHAINDIHEVIHGHFIETQKNSRKKSFIEASLKAFCVTV